MPSRAGKSRSTGAVPQTRLISTAEGSDSAIAEPDPQDEDMAPPMSASVLMLPQPCAEAFRRFEARNREQHPRSDVCFRLLDNDRIIATCCGCDEYFVVDLRLDPVTNSVLVGPSEMKDDSTLNADWTTLDAFAQQAATTLLRTRRFRARRQ